MDKKGETWELPGKGIWHSSCKDQTCEKLRMRYKVKKIIIVFVPISYFQRGLRDFFYQIRALMVSWKNNEIATQYIFLAFNTMYSI
jgi:hypothetical protein